ncbi:MAG: endolytic transglycosylase MltG [Syntrophales bacterium]|jgi:UPF0755 protein|nr:endolytic transglycosylase MltG [Syntrophales bacterium]MCK9528608.1 endolytic transglycosylase MltG [Syntrophales bacterium]MDX9923049.1 endolytic transglycosylase MltG [Syntrophales bacterium]
MKILRIILVVTVIVLVAALSAASFRMYRYAHNPLNPEIATVTILVPRGATLLHITALLEQEGLMPHPRAFCFLARLKGARDRMKAGEYELAGRATPLDVIGRMTRGEVKVYRVSVPEGFSMYQVAERFSAEGLADVDVFLRHLHDGELLSSLGIEGASAEGYLFPDTYHVTRAKDEEAIIRFMVRRFREEVSPDLVREAETLGLTLNELVTLASIIEKEAGCEDEKSLVSAVFHNRLKKGMRLQSDPTVIYGVEGFEGRIRKTDLERETPYNTYRIRGLPPGPICNPGASSILAALNPAPVDYLYFVSRNDGSHQFSSNLSDHNAAVIKYQIKRQK